MKTKAKNKLLLCFLFTAISMQLSVHAFEIAQTSTSTTKMVSSDLNKRLDDILKDTFQSEFSPGMSVAVVANGEIVFSKGYGFADLEKKTPITENTPFYIASTTKSFTAHIAILLSERGVIDLNVPVKQLMPQLKFHAGVDEKLVTLKTLLNHTHGIDGNGPITIRTAYTGEFSSSEELLELLPYHAPNKNGNAFTYSNMGPVLAAYIIEHVTGKTWKTLVQNEIYTPLKMQHSTNNVSVFPANKIALPYELSHSQFKNVNMQKSDKTMHAAGGSFSSAHDLAIWLAAHLNQGKWQGQQIFSASSIQQSLQKTTDQNRSVAGFQRTGWTLGWDIAQYKGHATYHRPGSFAGYFSHISMMPERGIGVVVLNNGGRLSSLLNAQIVDAIYAELLQEPDRDNQRQQQLQKSKEMYVKVIKSEQDSIDKRAARQQAMPLPMSNYAGVYQSKVGTIVCTIKDNRLHIKMGLIDDDAEVFNAETHEFRTELFGSGDVLKFAIANDFPIEFTLGGDLYKKLK